jgi:2-polyprenyl-6-methoxyphenol hydroxylase-like FAD-dependent oxidoreductase
MKLLWNASQPKLYKLVYKGDTMNNKQVLIVGGGIGGLTLALALVRRGWTPKVFERAPSLEPVGAGLAIWANAVRILAHLGVREPLMYHARTGASMAMRTWQGNTLIDANPDKMENLLGEQSVTIHRADLVQLLVNELPSDTFYLNAQVVEIAQNEQGASLQLADGREFHGDLLVGADGIRSIVRELVCGPTPLRYAGYTAWRGVTSFPQLEISGETLGQGARFGLLPMSDDRVYWYATQSLPADTKIEGGHREHLLKHFGNWHDPIPALLQAAQESEILHHDIYDLPPLVHWSLGRITLLGDAAHAMTPNLGQGACQAIEDAAVLARLVTEHTNLADALLAYEAERRPRVQQIWQQSRLLGEVGQWSNPLACTLRDGLFKYLANPMSGLQIRQVAGYKVKL